LAHIYIDLELLNKTDVSL